MPRREPHKHQASVRKSSVLLLSPRLKLLSATYDATVCLFSTDIPRVRHISVISPYTHHPPRHLCAHCRCVYYSIHTVTSLNGYTRPAGHRQSQSDDNREHRDDIITHNEAFDPVVYHPRGCYTDMNRYDRFAARGGSPATAATFGECDHTCRLSRGRICTRDGGASNSYQ